MDKIAVKLPDNLTPTDPSPTLKRIQGEGSAVPLSRSGREAGVALSRSAGRTEGNTQVHSPGETHAALPECPQTHHRSS